MKIRNPFLYLLLKTIAPLPFGVLYFFSDIFAVIIQYVIAYRKSIIANNLELAFPSMAKTEMKYFVNFMVLKTAFYDGMEKAARALNYAAVYLDIQKHRNGFYEVEIETITKNAAELPERVITKQFVQLLEQTTISTVPDNWLWSHNRRKTKEEVSS